MIRTEVSIHDKFSIEFNTGFLTDNKDKDINEFKINTWIFVPNGLDVNNSNYSKSDFYKDVKKNIRLITPVYSLPEILKEGRGPFARLDKAIAALKEDPTSEEKTEHYAYQIKMLQCIAQSALRQEAEFIVQNTSDAQIALLVKRYLSNIRAVSKEYRNKWEIINLNPFTDFQKNYYSFGDEFLGNIIEEYAYFLMRVLMHREVYEAIESDLAKLINEEEVYKKEKKYITVDKTDEKKNSLIISRRNILKKYIESDLFLHIVKKKDGAVAEQLYYTVVAGLVMLIATIVSTIATQRYGGYTSSLFVIVVVSYILRDRLKDMSRTYFQNSMSKKFFDTKLKLSVREQEIGMIKESFDYVAEGKVSDKLMRLRQRTPLFEAESKTYNEQIMLYRKWVSLSKSEIERYKEYRLSGIKDITRLNIHNFTQKMDDPLKTLNILGDDNELICIDGLRVYMLYFILQCKSDSVEYFKSYRVSFNRNGIKDIEELK